MHDHFEIGLNSFGEVPLDNGRRLSDAETIRLAIEEATLAESVGVDIFSIGEHYRRGFTDSAGAVTLAAIATATERITVAQTIARVPRSLHLSRFDLKYDILDLPRDARAKTIELLGTVVAPCVRELLAKEPAHV